MLNEFSDNLIELINEEKITIDIDEYTHVTPRISETERYEKEFDNNWFSFRRCRSFGIGYSFDNNYCKT